MFQGQISEKCRSDGCMCGGDLVTVRRLLACLQCVQVRVLDVCGLETRHITNSILLLVVQVINFEDVCAGKLAKRF